MNTKQTDPPQATLEMRRPDDDRPLLPEGWVWTTLEEVADTTRKRMDPQEQPHLRFIGMEHIEAHTMKLLGTVFAGEMKSASEYFGPGDVLYGRLRPYLNKVYRPDFEGLCSAEFIVFRQVPHLNGKYLQFFLNSWDFVSFASHLNEGDRPRVNFSQLAQYPFPLPPLPEQHRIVDAIETQFTRLDAAAAALHRVKANLARYKASVLKAACEGRLVPTDADIVRSVSVGAGLVPALVPATEEGNHKGCPYDYPDLGCPYDYPDQDCPYEPADILLRRILAERRARWMADNPGKRYTEPQGPDTSDLPKLPEGWCWANVDQVAEHRLGKMLDKEKNQGELRPYLRNLNVRWFGFDLSDIQYLRAMDEELDNISVRKDDLVICEGGEPGRAAVWSAPESMVIQKALHRVRFENGVSPYYLGYRLAFDAGNGGLERYFTGSTIKHFTGQSLNSYTFPLPPTAEQHRIVAEVERRLSVVAEVEAAVDANLARAERLRQAILKRAFEGRLVPQDPDDPDGPDDEPASALLERIRQIT